MVLEIVKYGDPVLAKPAEEVTVFDAGLRDLVANMFETMYAAPGVGLAANQVGISKRIFVMDCTSGNDPNRKFTVINPVIDVTEGEQVGREGCLSVPGYFFEIERPNRAVVKGLDVNGDPLELDVTGLEARCVCHETDHLNGKLLLTRISRLKRDLTVRKIKKQMKTGEW